MTRLTVGGSVGHTVTSTVGSTVDKVGDLGSYLREQRQHAQLSLRQLAEAAGVSNPYLSQIERGVRHPSAAVLQQIATGLRISAEALYVRAGIVTQDGAVSDVAAAVLADPTLSERQKRVLLDIYTSFHSEALRADGPLGASTDATAPADSVAPVKAKPAPKRKPRKRSAPTTR